MACLPTLEIESGGFGFGRRRAFRPGGQSIDGLRQSTPITASQGHQTFRSIDRSIFTPRQSVPKRRSPRSWQPAHSLTSVMMFRGFGVHSEEASCRSPALRTSHTLLSGANHPPPPPAMHTILLACCDAISQKRGGPPGLAANGHSSTEHFAPPEPVFRLLLSSSSQTARRQTHFFPLL